MAQGMLGILKKDYIVPPELKHEQAGEGLSSREAQLLLDRDGANILAEKKRSTAFMMFAGQFRDVLVLILLASTVVSALLGEYYDAVTIAVVVLLNAVLGFVQEYRTERTLEALRDLAAPTAKVYRDGKLTELPASLLVCGDVLEVEAGDRVPADAEILSGMALFADESMLTGEALPAGKLAGTAPDNALNRSEVLYMGTVITSGHGMARVISTGMHTQMGRMSGMLAEITEEETPLQKRLGKLGKQLAVGCLVICAVVALVGIIRGEDPFQMLLLGISLAVAAVPEGLPAAVTIALALAVRRMLARNALVHRLHAVETLGCASVICSDKTGTITENRMTVKSLYYDGEELSVTGDGYRRSGGVYRGEELISPLRDKRLAALLSAGVLCGNARLESETDASRNRSEQKQGGEWSGSGDPTELALLVAAAKCSITQDSLRGYTRVDEAPFDSTTRSMTVVVRDQAGNHRAFLKGAVDVILEKCGFILTSGGVRPLTPADRRDILAANDAMTERALRVLGFAARDLRTSSVKEAGTGFLFLGLQGMADPPRQEVKDAVRLCRSAKVRTVMITGDHPNTASAVAKQAGILYGGLRTMTGKELEALSDEELVKQLDTVAVFARVSPTDKLRIVRAFKQKGQIVAMTGDGVNDAPAVKEANIGVSMGISGTDVTREAADIVLLDDNFATLVGAVEQGRVVYANIRKFIRYLLSCNIGEVVTMLLGMLLGLPVILLPIQILLVNLVTDGLPAVALGVEPPEPDAMRAPPRKGDEGVFAGGLLFTIGWRGVLIGLSTIAAFLAVRNGGGTLPAARTAALFTLAMTQLFHVFECKREHGSIFNVPYFNNMKLILAVLFSALALIGAIWFPPLQSVFETVSLTMGQTVAALLCALIAPLLMAAMLRGRKSQG